MFAYGLITVVKKKKSKKEFAWASYSWADAQVIKLCLQLLQLLPPQFWGTVNYLAHVHSARNYRTITYFKHSINEAYTISLVPTATAPRVDYILIYYPPAASV